MLLSVALRISLGSARTKAEETIRLALLLETDVLLSIIAATTCLFLRYVAPQSHGYAQVLALVSWAYIYISISASWAIAGRFVEEHEHWAMSRTASTILVLAPSALGPPAMCAAILPFTFPLYTRQWAAMHFALALIPALVIGRFAKRSKAIYTLPLATKTSTPLSSSPNPTSTPSSTSTSSRPSLLIHPPLAYRESKPIPMRVAVLRGAQFPRKKPMIHPLIKKRQYRHKSPLKFETAQPMSKFTWV
ncbi:hypothetical protein T439DRAFT_322345 [Meredithblackwellia eburnea MCA 4105]